MRRVTRFDKNKSHKEKDPICIAIAVSSKWKRFLLGCALVRVALDEAVSCIYESFAASFWPENVVPVGESKPAGLFQATLGNLETAETNFIPLVRLAEKSIQRKYTKYKNLI